MRSPYIDLLVREAWEEVPRYSKKMEGPLKVAIANKQGNCSHHATLIGRNALMDGTPAMRSILFGADNKVTHHSTILYVGSWVRVSTDRNPNIWYDTEELRPIDGRAIGWAACLGDTLHAVDDLTRAAAVSELVIPETSMSIFRRARTSDDFLTVARGTLGLIMNPQRV